MGKNATNKVQIFEAALEKGDRALGWTIARVPFDPAKVWKKMMRLRVRGTVNGYGFRTSLFPDGDTGRFCLLVNKAAQAGGRVRLGQMAEFTLVPDLEERAVELPDELAVLLDEEEGLREWYDALTEYTRREIGKWICGVKSDASRMKRAEQMAERLLATMEAEVTLPPVVERAFRSRPKARAGWAKMTELQRRGELMAVFYYQTPEARQKRVGRLCEAAEKKA
jgi:uncharacterized protein YdeI (YjbR/CyaY-like superfamily)